MLCIHRKTAIFTQFLKGKKTSGLCQASKFQFHIVKEKCKHNGAHDFYCRDKMSTEAQVFGLLTEWSAKKSIMKEKHNVRLVVCGSSQSWWCMQTQDMRSLKRWVCVHWNKMAKWMRNNERQSKQNRIDSSIQRVWIHLMVAAVAAVEFEIHNS